MGLNRLEGKVLASNGMRSRAILYESVAGLFVNFLYCHRASQTSVVFVS